MPSAVVEERVYADGGVAVALRTPQAWKTHLQGRAIAQEPLVSFTHRPGPAPKRRGKPRVLDFTRVIAGPVATRTLAWVGADVLRIDPPSRPEIEALHLDTGAGKRTALLDARETGPLVDAADVVVIGYRPGALDTYGLGVDDLLARNPRLVVATLSAWGATGPWRNRRGFDSIVQAATGIGVVEGGVVEGGADRPGVLAAQALDHATGYLIAAAVLTALSRQTTTGGGYTVGASLARTAQWLLDQPPTDTTGEPDPTPYLVERPTYAGPVRGPLPALALPNAPADFPFPARQFGADPAQWT
jgi:crotonobetainyl-CoA:carnitine CoA-transferase CaiB-like acyl-CoA transferase